MHAGLRKAIWKSLGAFAIMSGGALLVLGVALQAVAPGPSSDAPKTTVVPGVNAYSSAFIQDVLYGALIDWDPTEVQEARDLGAGIASQLSPADAAALALVGDQVAYMDWLLACHDVLDDAMGTIEAGAFGTDQDALLQAVATCRDDLLGLTAQVLADAAHYPGYGYASVPRYGMWEKAAFVTARQLDARASAAIDAVSPYSAYFQGEAAPGFPSMASVEALLASKSITTPLESPSSEAVVLFSDKIDAASAVAFWLRHAQALGKPGLGLSLGYVGSDPTVCAVTTEARYCPLQDGAVTLGVSPANATYNAHGLSVFSAANPDNDEDWGLVVRNAGPNATGELTLEVSCADGSVAEDWSLSSIGSQASAFSSHAFPDDVSCPALLQVRSSDGVLLLARTGQIAGEFGFTV